MEQRVTRAESIDAALERARTTLRPGPQTSRENVLIAGTPRTQLRGLIRDAREGARNAQTGYELHGRVLNAVTRELLDATPQGGDTPQSAEIHERLRPTLEGTPFTAEIHGRLEQVTERYGQAWRDLTAARSEEALANRTERHARRLGRVPQVLAAAGTVAVIGGAGFWATQSLNNQARHELDSGRVRVGTSQYRALQNQANGFQTDMVEGSIGAGSVLGAGAAWLLTDDRLARPLARVTVARQRNKKGKAAP